MRLLVAISLLWLCACQSLPDEGTLKSQCVAKGVRFCFINSTASLEQRPTGMHFIIFDGEINDVDIGVYESYAPSFHDYGDFEVEKFERTFGSEKAQVEARISIQKSQAIINMLGSEPFPTTLHVWADSPEYLNPKSDNNIYSNILLFRTSINSVKSE